MNDWPVIDFSSNEEKISLDSRTLDSCSARRLVQGPTAFLPRLAAVAIRFVVSSRAECALWAERA